MSNGEDKKLEADFRKTAYVTNMVCATAILLAALLLAGQLYSAKRRWDIIDHMQDGKHLMRAPGPTEED